MCVMLADYSGGTLDAMGISVTVYKQRRMRVLHQMVSLLLIIFNAPNECPDRFINMEPYNLCNMTHTATFFTYTVYIYSTFRLLMMMQTQITY